MYTVEDTYANFSKELIYSQDKQGEKHKLSEKGHQLLISSSFITALLSFPCDSCFQGKCLAPGHRISDCFLSFEEQ
jgi:hypothetical protein